MTKLSVIKLISTVSVVLLIFAVGWFALSRMMQLTLVRGGDFQDRLFSNIPHLNQNSVDNYLENVNTRKIYNENSFPSQYSQIADPFNAAELTDNEF